MNDLLCLVADKNMEAVVGELLRRHEALGICRIAADVLVHPRRDPGVFREGVSFVRSFQKNYHHALLLLDAAWEGAPENVQEHLDSALDNAGLRDWAAAIVIVPELEIWVWSDSPHVEQALGWSGRKPALRAWLEQKGLWGTQDPKPKDPKTAVERALEQVGKPRSSAIYRALARNVTLARCEDSAFRRLRETLQTWFGGSA